VSLAGRAHSFTGYFIFSLLFFPAAIITAYLVHLVPGGVQAGEGGVCCDVLAGADRAAGSVAAAMRSDAGR
jgi:hypothetical protein